MRRLFCALAVASVALTACSRPADVAASRAFVDVIDRVGPVAERECRARTGGQNCDFRILVDSRWRQPANAFQTLDEDGKPIIVFTIALLRDAANADEVAFVLGHETAHHIEQHIDRQRANAQRGEALFRDLANQRRSDPRGLARAERIGAATGARLFSQEYELEADALGTLITARAGYDPVRGAQFFNRIPDPGDTFFSTHPPNAQRLELVERVARSLAR